MATEAYPGVIVSGNRFNDIEPYAKRLFESDQKTWGSIFPWEFPQNGTREQEETFLRQFFSDNEIHMQGGAAGQGSGFRFLKQVWYSIALCNIEHRVPYAEEWYWQQPDNIALLNDLSMKDYILNRDAKPSTFFGSNETQKYSEKVLKTVVDRIQLTARTYYEQLHFNSAVDVLEISKGITQNINKSFRPQSDTIVKQEASAAVPIFKPKARTTQQVVTYQQPDLPHTQEAIPHKVHYERTSNNGEAKIRPAKRGGYYGNKRSGQHYGRHYNDDSSTQQLPSQAYGTAPAAPYIQKRGPSGVHADFMPAIPQRQPLFEPDPPMHQEPHPHRFHNMNSTRQHPIPHDGPYLQGQHPIYYSTNAFGDHGQIPFPEISAGGNLDFAVADGSYNGRYEGRHNSISWRGRGYGSVRGRGGRGSRGRNSFGTADQVPHLIKGDGFNHRGGGVYRGRRYSGVSDGWRSGYDHHQSGTMKENIAPGQAFSRYEQHPAPQMRGPTYKDEVNSSFAGMNRSISGANDQHHRGEGPRQASHAFIRQPLYKQPVINEVATCGQDWISPECMTVRKLVAFDVPLELTDDTLLHTLRQYGDVAVVRRHIHSRPDTQTKTPTGLVFLMFDHPQAARLFFENKPKTWLDDIPLKVEVAKEHWDPTHKSNQERFGSKPFYPWKNEVRKDTPFIEKAVPPGFGNRVNQGANEGGNPRSFSKDWQGQQEIPSEDNTPTPSGSNTPKKKKKSHNKKRKDKEINDSLRKLSLIANADQRVQSDQTNDHTTAPNNDTVTVNAPEASNSLLQPKQDDAMKQVGESSRESASSETDNFNTKQSDTLSKFKDDQLQSTVYTELPSDTAAAASTTPTERAISSGAVPYDESHEHKSDNQFFRPSQKEEKKAQAATVGSASHSPSSLTTQSLEQAPTRCPDPDQGNPDDSFHTASDSPASMDDAGTEKQSESTASPLASETVNSSGPDTTSAMTDTTSESSHAEVTSQECMCRDIEVSQSTSASNPNTEAEAMDRNSEEPCVKASSMPNATVTVTTTVENQESPESSKTVSPIAPKPKVTITICDSDHKSTEPQSEKRSTSGSTIAALTPTFVTAPNTPALIQDTPITETTEDVTQAAAQPEAPQVKKVDKAKGPAQTESLSLFGRKKEKKPKSAKKGTIKGKPNANEKSTELTSGESSRRTSEFQGPRPVVAQDGKATEGGKKGNDDGGSHDAASKPLKAQKSSKKGVEVGAKAPGGQEEPTSTAVEESPSKRKGNKFGNMISNLFGGSGGGGGGAHSQTPALEPTALNDVPPMSLLTDSKAQGLPLKSEIKQIDVAVDEERSLGGNEAATLDKQNVAVPDSAMMMDSPATGNGNYILEGGSDARVDDGPVGLGIADISTRHQTDHGVKAKKKRKRQPKKKKKESGAGADSVAGDGEPSEQSTPVSESKPGMYRFGGKEPVPTSPTDVVSPISSTTQSGNIPSSESPSPFATGPGRKIMASPGTDHLVQPKTPAWLKKRGPISRASELVVDEEEDEEEADEDDEKIGRIITLDPQESEASDDTQSDGTMPSLDSNGNRPKRLYIYVGPGRIADAGDDLRLEQSQDEQQTRALKEFKRMCANDEFGNGEFDDTDSSSLRNRLTDPASSAAESTS